MEPSKVVVARARARTPLEVRVDQRLGAVVVLSFGELVVAAAWPVVP
jgi:hypothetical protein